MFLLEIWQMIKKVLIASENTAMVHKSPQVDTGDNHRSS